MKKFVKKTLRFLDQILAYIANFLIVIYQYTLSPDKGLPSLWLKGRVCAHEPHCSQYGKLSFKRYGFFGGIFKVMDRVFRCKPSYKKIYDPTHYRVVFLSGAPIGIPFLQELAQDKRFDVVGVVTMPDKARDRGQKVQENIIKTEAKTLDIDFFTPNKLNPEKSEEGKKFASWLKEKNVDFLVTIAYGKIIPQTILDLAKIKPVNVHGSLLPKYRGASPIQSVFLANEKESGLTIMEMVKKMDAGPMLDKLKIKLKFDRTAKDLIEAFQDKGPKFLNTTLWKYGKKMLGEVEQDKKLVSTCGKIEKSDAEININKTPLEEVYNKYRAYALWPKVFFFWKEKRVIVEKLVLDEKLFTLHSSGPVLKNKSQSTTKNNHGGPVLNPAIVELIVKPEGKKTMSWDDFLKGY